MSNQLSDKEVLEACIQKAINGGWDFDGLLAPMDPGKYKVIAPFGGDYLRVKTTSWSGEESFESINSVIYSKNFAVCLWGDSKTLNLEEVEQLGYQGGLGAGIQTLGWQQHLQAMVISPNPIHYLREHAL